MLNPATLSIADVKELIESANFADLERRSLELQDRIRALEKEVHEEALKRKRLVLRELVKVARTKILETSRLAPPTPKQSWGTVLNSLTNQQLIQANIPLKYWPRMKEILCPSSVKLNSWAYGYTPWDLAAIIKGMDSDIQATWAEIFKLVNKGQAMEQFLSESAEEDKFPDGYAECDSVIRDQIL